MSLFVAAVAAAEDGGGGEAKKLRSLVLRSRLGVRKLVKLYNEEPLQFRARSKGGAVDLHEVEFVLFTEGGSPDRPETVRARVKDTKRWGRPPSTFSFPRKYLPAGRYRLRATKKGYAAAEVSVVIAKFWYADVTGERTETKYVAGFRLKLVDVTEKRDVVRVTIRVEGPNGEEISVTSRALDRIERPGKPDLHRSEPIRLSSQAPKDGPVLKVIPGSSLAVVLDGFVFRYPIPLGLQPSSNTRRQTDRRGR